MKRECELSAKEFDSMSSATLLITERKEDPITPLVFDWSYISLLNELIHVDDNKVNLKGEEGMPNKSYNLFAEEDEFLRENLYSNYGEVASNIETFVKKVSDKKKNQAITNFEDMKKVLDSMPEMRRESGNLSKHYELIGEIIKKVKTRRLLEIGEIEQTLVSKEQKNESLKAITDLIPDEKYSSFDILRLVILYSLKYEGDPKAGQLYQKLKERLGPDVGLKFLTFRTSTRSKPTKRC